MLVNSFIKIVGKMIMADDKIRPEEMQFISSVKDELNMSDAALQSLLKEARESTLEQLAADIDKQEDKLFIVQQAYYAAQCDKDYALSEMKVFDDLVNLFGIPKKDVERIKRSAEMLEQGKYDLFFDKDISYLHNNYLHSSFADLSK